MLKFIQFNLYLIGLGYNMNGQLYDGREWDSGFLVEHMGDNRPIIDVGTGVVPIRVIAGTHNNCFISSTGKLKCWGFNKHVGMLGIDFNV